MSSHFRLKPRCSFAYGVSLQYNTACRAVRHWPSTRVGGRQGVGMAEAFHQELEYSFGGIPRQVMEVLLRKGRLAEKVEQLLHERGGIE